MGTNCALLVADLFLFCYESDCIMSLSVDKQADIIETLNTTSRYLDDNLNIVYISQLICCQIVGTNIFLRSLVKWFLIIKRLVITIMHCDRLHAWWSTQTRLTTLLSSFIARQWAGPNPL